MSGDHPLKIGKYDVMEPLGEGGMGVVYKARDPIIDRIVAIKTIRGGSDFSDENLVARLTQEAKAAGRLQHPNIVTVFDFGQQDDLTYLAMEFIEGTNLARVIAKGRQVSLATKVDIIIQICNGLAYAHEIGVVHRDIKPANICLTANGTPKILDFGLARFDETRLTKTGFTSGTVQYMSPERMRGKSGPHDDIFAIGAVAYEILTHQPAFPGKTYKDVVTKIMSPKFPLPPSEVADLPKGFDPIIGKALARDLGQRYKSASEMARDLERLRNSPEFLSVVSGESLGRTIEQSLDVFDQTGSGSHPYSAGSIEHRQNGDDEPPTDQYAQQPTDVGEQLDNGDPPTVATDLQALQHAPTTVTREQPEVEEETETWQDLHFKKTEMDLTPVSRESRADAPAPTKPGTDPTEKTEWTPPPSPSVPYTPPGAVQPPSGPVSRTEVAAPGDKLVRPSDEPEITPIAEPTELDQEVLREQRAESATAGFISKLIAKPFNPSLAVLCAATLSATLAAHLLGTFAFLIIYAVAAVIWTFLIRSAPRMSLDRIIMIAIGLRLLCFFVAPTLSNDIYRFQWDGLVASADMNPWEHAPSSEELAPLRNDAYAHLDQPDVPSNRAPLTALVSLIWSWTGNSLPMWRLALLGFDVLIVWLLWSPKVPRRSLAWATMPFVVLEGVWGGHIELIGAALLVAAFVLGSKQKGLSAGATLGLSAGTSILPVAAIPALTHTVNRRLKTWVGFLALVLVPYLWVGFGNALFDPLTRAVSQSPSLSLAQTELASLIERTDFATKFADGWKNVSGRVGLGQLDGWVAAHLDGPALAGIAIAIGVLVLLTFVAEKSSTNETAFANCIGIALVVSFAVDPWYWILVVPFALMSNRPLWVLFALFSPALYLASERSGDVNWLVYAVSYVMPLLALIGTKISSREAGLSAFDYR